MRRHGFVLAGIVVIAAAGWIALGRGSGDGVLAEVSAVSRVPTLRAFVTASGEIFRAAVLGAMAPELASVLALGMDRRVGIGAFARLPLPRPSLFSILSRLGETYSAQKPVSVWASRSRTLRRLVQRPFRG